MTDRTFDNATEWAVSTTNATLSNNETYRARWSDNVIEALRQIGIFGTFFAAPSDTPPTDLTQIWIDTSQITGKNDVAATIRYYNPATSTWTEVTDFAQIFNAPTAQRSGTTTERNTFSTSYGTNQIGVTWFNTTTGIPNWWDGTQWVDATGTAV